MNKKELSAAVSERTGLTKKDAEDVINAFIDAVSSGLKSGEEIHLTGFGTFKVSDRAAREGRNPTTGEPVLIPAARVPKFSPGKSLREAVNCSDCAD